MEGRGPLVTFADAIRHFADPQAALELMAGLRWPGGVRCPHCGSGGPAILKSRPVWKCRARECRKQFSVRIGTILEDSPIGLQIWLACLWAVANERERIGSHRAARALGLTQKSAWFMRHRIKLAMRTRAFTMQDDPRQDKAPVTSTADASATGEERASLERLAAFARRLLAVPKAEIDREAAEWVRVRKRRTIT